MSDTTKPTLGHQHDLDPTAIATFSMTLFRDNPAGTGMTAAQVHALLDLKSRNGKNYPWPLAATTRYMALLEDAEIQRLMADLPASRDAVVARGTELLKAANPKDKCWLPGLMAVSRALADAQHNAKAHLVSGTCDLLFGVNGDEIMVSLKTKRSSSMDPNVYMEGAKLDVNAAEHMIRALITVVQQAKKNAIDKPSMFGTQYSGLPLTSKGE